MSIRKPLIGFGVFALVSILVTVVIWNTLARTVSGGTNSYTATFSDVLGLRSGDDVRIAGVRIGKVTSIDLNSQHQARVRFVVQNDQPVYHDTKALIRYQNLIGQRYVALTLGTEGQHLPLPNHGSIPLSQTEPSFDLSALLNGFQPLFATLQPQQVNDLSNTFIQALQGNGVSLSEFLTQAAGLAGDWQRRDAILSDVITNLSGVMQGLAKRGDELETLITQTRSLINGLYQQGQSLEGSTTEIANDTTSLVNMVSNIQPKLQAAQDSTSDAFTMLIANGDKLNQAAVDLPDILADVAKFTQDGSYASAYVCSLDVSLYGVLLPRGLFSQIGGNSHSAVCRP